MRIQKVFPIIDCQKLRYKTQKQNSYVTSIKTKCFQVLKELNQITRPCRFLMFTRGTLIENCISLERFNT